MAESKKHGICLEWKNVSLSATVDDQVKTILSDISAFAVPGETLAIMGPSGAGKTSLLNCLAQRNTTFTGEMHINKRQWSSGAARVMAYMTQDDLFFPDITVGEHLHFQAQMRLPSSVSAGQRKERVKSMLQLLGLNEKENALIGDALSLRSISRNERKRLNFASEMITDPSLLFVDEPTTGLDSFMAENVVEQLKALASDAKDPRTVILTIHQPSTAVFNQLDKLLWLVDGRVAYFGPAKDAVAKFEAQGFVQPAFCNVAEYIMRIFVDPDDPTGSKQRGADVCDAFAKSDEAKAVADLWNSPGNYECAALDDGTSYKASPLKQFLVLIKREQKQRLRSVPAFRANFGRIIILGTLFGLTYLQMEVEPEAVFSLNALMFFILLMQAMTCAMGLATTIPLTLPTMFREHKSGSYRVSTFFFAKNVADLPFDAVFCFLWTMVIYWMVGFGRNDFVHFLGMYVIILLMTICAMGIGYLAAAIGSSDPNVAQVVNIVLVLPFVLFGGLMVNFDDIATGVRWIKEISIFRYGFTMLLVNQWEDFGSIDCPTPYEWLAGLSDKQKTLVSARIRQNAPAMLKQMSVHSNMTLPTSFDLQDLGPNHPMLTMMPKEMYCPYPDGTAVLDSMGVQADEYVFCLIMVLVFAVLYRALALRVLLKKAAKMTKEMGTKADAESALGNAEDGANEKPVQSATGGEGTQTRQRQIELAFSGLTRTVTLPKTKKAEATKKTILAGITGKVVPGELVAIMGPSGCGKSQLLQILSGYVTPDEGSVTYNAKKVDSSSKRKIGYMHQEEVFFGNLTVREHLLFQAKLRLGKGLSPSEQQERVDSAIKQLGLTKCENTLIGVIGAGISGGERKRLAFASEMLIDPQLVLCDEPTSGLDSAMAECVVDYLHSMTKGDMSTVSSGIVPGAPPTPTASEQNRKKSVLSLGGSMSTKPRTTLCTIHQPSPEVYAMFDKVMFLCDGQVCYFGSRDEMPAYLQNIGFECPKNTFPPEHMLRLISSSGTIENEQLQAKLETCQKVISSWAQHQAKQANDIVPQVSEDQNPEPESQPGGLGILMKRELLLRKRSKFMFKAVIGRTVFFGALMGFVWWQVPIDGSLQALQSVNGALNMLCINSFITFAIGPVQTLPFAMGTILREYDMGMYTLPQLFWSKTLSDFPLDCLFVVILSTIPFWMIGFSDDFLVYLQFMGVLGLSVFIGSSFGYMASFKAKSPEGAFVLTLATVFPCIMFNGFVISYEQIPPYFKWLEAISFAKYVFEGLITVVWGSKETLGCEPGRVCPFVSGKAVLEFMGTTDEYLLRDVLIGLIFIVVFRCLALFFLIRRRP